METSRKQIILDCDPGHDDAVAILLAAAAQELDLLGITTVAGNSYLENTTRNALSLCTLAGIDVPVCPGIGRPLVREQITAHEVHGPSGLDGAELPEPKRKSGENAVDFIADQVSAHPGKITLVAVGPLTNIATFLIRYPELTEAVGSLVFMGGGIGFGNVTPAAEFNIYADPEAAAVVFKSSIETTMFPLDLTHQVMIADAEIATIRSAGSPVANALADLLTYTLRTCQTLFGLKAAPLLHDPCTIIYLTHPGLFEVNRYWGGVELKGEYTYGQTVVDRWGVTGRPPNIQVAERVDREAFLEVLYELLGRY
ncbi:MAG: nucleoside hydrolase [Candidatus Bipolaricaulia bacterium]